MLSHFTQMFNKASMFVSMCLPIQGGPDAYYFDVWALAFCWNSLSEIASTTPSM